MDKKQFAAARALMKAAVKAKKYYSDVNHKYMSNADWLFDMELTANVEQRSVLHSELTTASVIQRELTGSMIDYALTRQKNNTQQPCEATHFSYTFTKRHGKKPYDTSATILKAKNGALIMVNTAYLKLAETLFPNHHLECSEPSKPVYVFWDGSLAGVIMPCMPQDSSITDKIYELLGIEPQKPSIVS